MKTLISVDIATSLVRNNSNNRPLSPGTVKKYAKEMTLNNWVYNGESIKITKNNNIIDGQHRLHAVIMSGVSIETEVIENIENDVFDTIDVGRTRTNADIFSINGVLNYARAAACVNPLYLLNHSKRPNFTKSALSKKEALKYYKQHKRNIDIAVHAKRFPGMPLRFVDCCYAYLLQFNEEKEVKDFFASVCSGRFGENDNQAFLLRDWMIKVISNKKYKPSGTEIMAKILKAYKNKKSGLNPPFVRWSELGNERFPYDDDDHRLET